MIMGLLANRCFSPFILVATFTMLNLFIAIIVNAMQPHSERAHQDTAAAVEKIARPSRPTSMPNCVSCARIP